MPPGALTKYRPPTPARSLVTRARLTDRLCAGGHRRLIVIHGPAGFGKTTLAAQWREVLVDEGVTVAWLTIDSDDNNVVWFLAHLVEAVRIVRPTLAEGLQRALEARGNEAGRYVLASLINEIHENGDRIAIIIDDWHRVTGAATIEALTYLLDRGGHLLQVVVTSRTRAGLPMSRMRVLDELIEIDGAALRFDLPESRAFLLDVGGLALDDRDVAHLEQTTDGWVAALQLASLSLRDCVDPAGMIDRMSGRHHAIDEYLAENVLDSLEPEMLDFLMATSITERVSGDLASALADVGHGQALLEQAESHDLFLRRLDDEREWFCYHHLFAEFLLRRLERDQPERIVRLHATASRWFAEHDLMREAVDHAIAAGEDERAVELMELHGIELTQRAQDVDVAGTGFQAAVRLRGPQSPIAAHGRMGEHAAAAAGSRVRRAGCVRIRRRKARALRARTSRHAGGGGRHPRGHGVLRRPHRVRRRAGFRMPFEAGDIGRRCGRIGRTCRVVPRDLPV